MDQEQESKPKQGSSKPGTFQPGHRGYKRKGSVSTITRTMKESMLAAANLVGGEKGATGVFEQAGKKDIVAFAGMLTKLVPQEIKEEITGIVPGIGQVNIINVPPGHQFCPDGKLRPCEEAEVLWRSHNAKSLTVEPEIDLSNVTPIR